jgi:hypothetical protein
MSVVTGAGTARSVAWSVELLISAATGGADLALDNLSSVAINTSLLPGTTNSINLGSVSKVWANAFLTNASTTDITISGDLFDSANSAGTNGYVLQSNGSGVVWVATSSLGISGGGGGGAPGGSNGQIQFNNSGVFGASTTLTWDNVLGNLTSNYFTATSTTATSTFMGGFVAGNGALSTNFVTGVTSISSLQTGNLNFDTDAGVVSWTDLPIDANASSGTVESYTAQLGGNPVLTIYGTADGSGGLTTGPYVGIGTTTPKSTLTVVGSGCFSVGSGATSACGTTAGNIYYTAANTGNYDVAEKYAVSDSSIVAGDIVALDPNNSLSLIKATKGSQVIGIVSTDPGLILGGSDPAAQGTSSRPIALSGRVPVKVSLDNGSIAIGDTIAISSVPGVGEKASNGDGTIGIALQPFTASSTGPIQVFVNLHQAVDFSELMSQFALTSTSTSPAVTGSSTSSTTLPIIQYSSGVSGSSGMSASDIATLASTTATAAAQSVASATVASLLSSSTTLNSIASSTSDTLASSTPSFIARIASAVMTSLQSATNWVFDRLSATVVITNDIQTQTLEAQTASVTNGLQMTDSVTGSIYCVRITNGDLARTPGSCSSATSTQPVQTPDVVSSQNNVNYVSNQTSNQTIVTDTSTTTTATTTIATTTTVVATTTASTSSPIVSSSTSSVATSTATTSSAVASTTVSTIVPVSDSMSSTLSAVGSSTQSDPLTPPSTSSASTSDQ